jgi:hypothetical protein
MAPVIVICRIIGAVMRLAGGATRHAQRYRRTGGLHPNLCYTYGRGWNGSIRLPGGFRVSPAPSFPP